MRARAVSNRVCSASYISQKTLKPSRTARTSLLSLASISPQAGVRPSYPRLETVVRERRTGFMKTHSGSRKCAHSHSGAMENIGVADPTHHDPQVGANSPLKKSAFQAFLPGQNLREVPLLIDPSKKGASRVSHFTLYVKSRVQLHRCTCSVVWL